ncbi:DNA-directed RNA polymerase subunit omega [Acetilactobacillus jinshanensis]|uniref:DNA-directed RNA polymerase subunit omega n=1 Tax=Acetilactobacillus jinshanensis TaxID=1720083 RepID=A0A4V1ALS6_9LACO|nr:DNA-directed RNA polymerase subunit omega [Acetilactobacillus jinshanensis]QBP18629.1 DNA-directed RNA polymerase subunit omega [Acetilactobacillus jinshanensis]URL61505.1 DNA-directed RNA polymerase subunit omega [uncultured bacterium]
MLMYPTIDKLLEKVPSYYSLTILASKRAKQLDAGAKPLLKHYHSKKNVGKAFEEIAAGKLKIDHNK